MPCNAIATISTKISNETFNKIKNTQQVRQALERFLLKNNLDPNKLSKTENGYSYYNKGTYIIIQGDKLSVTSTTISKEAEQELATALGTYINQFTNGILSKYIKRVAENKGYRIINEEINSEGTISLVIEKI